MKQNKNKFNVGDTIKVNSGSYKGQNFTVTEVDRTSHETLELIKCIRDNDSTVYNFDNICADVIVRAEPKIQNVDNIRFVNCINHFKKVILSEIFNYDPTIVCWISGGSVRDYFMSKPTTNDYDIFFSNIEHLYKLKNYLISNNGKMIWESDNGCKISYKGKTFDLIKRLFNDPQHCIDNFDFTVSCFAVSMSKVYYNENSFIDLAKMQLMINTITIAKSTLYRAFKYTKKGFTICTGELKKITDRIETDAIDNHKNISIDISDIDTNNSDLMSSGEFIGFD